MFRLVEDHRVDAQGSASRDREGGLGVHVRRCGVQPGAHAQSAGPAGWCRMRLGSSVFDWPEKGPLGLYTRTRSRLKCVRSPETAILRDGYFCKLAIFRKLLGLAILILYWSGPCASRVGVAGTTHASRDRIRCCNTP